MSLTIATDPLLGKTIAQRYRLISRLGEGTAARVYLARHVLIERLSAIKLVHPELLRDPISRSRFLREARAVNRINHPNIVEISDYGEADGSLYLVMEYVPGESLGRILSRGPIGWRRAASLGSQVASALGRAHQMGVIHRDLKPANVLVVQRRDGGELAKLTDFGLARMSDAPPLTDRKGAVCAASPYDAPELIAPGEADPRSDLFALGVVLFEATSGALPPIEHADMATELLARSPEAPTFFAEIVATLLADAPTDRPRDGFETADLLARALRHAQACRPPEAETSPASPKILPSAKKRVAESRDSIAGSLVGTARKRLSTTPVDRLGPMCEQGLQTLLEHIRDQARPRELDLALMEARKLGAAVHTVGALVVKDSLRRDEVEAHGRALLAQLGKELDEVACEHSKALGWAGTIAERSYDVEAARLSGTHPAPVVDAMVWEQAALEQEEDRVRDTAAKLRSRMEACQANIQRHSEQLEYELAVLNACLDGRIAALRSLAVEAWTALEGAARLAEAPMLLS